MRVFLTGATGYLGSEITRELIGRGHSVTGLVRSQEKVSQLTAAGAAAVVGSILEPSSYAGAAREHDAIIHAAFQYGTDGVRADLTAIEALIGAAEASGQPRSLVFTSGVWVLGNTGDVPATEDTSPSKPANLVAWRPAHERRILAAAGGPVRSAVIRPGIVYGGKQGLVSPMFEQAQKEGVVAYVGDGQNHWGLIHRGDLAALYATVVERSASGIFHAVDGHPVRLQGLAKAVSAAAGRGGQTRSVPVEEARRQMGPMADALCLDQVVAAPRALDLGWKPRRRSFLDEAKAAYQEWKS